MNQELKHYLMSRLEQSSVSVFNGHLPKFETKEEVDAWIDDVECVKVYMIKRKPK